MSDPTNVQVGDVVMYVPACAGDRTECVHEPIAGDRAAMVNHVEDGGVLGTWHFRGPADDLNELPDVPFVNDKAILRLAECLYVDYDRNHQRWAELDGQDQRHWIAQAKRIASVLGATP